MNKNAVVEFAHQDEVAGPLTEFLRKGAREFIQQAAEAELAAYPGSTPGSSPERWQSRRRP